MNSLLYERLYKINDKINIVIPKVGEIIDDEDEYYGIISVLTSMPIDMMVQLDDIGIDFTTINDYQLFLLMFPTLRSRDTSLVFGDLDMTLFNVAVNDNNGETVLIDTQHDIVIDRSVYTLISTALRNIHHLEKNIKKPGNEEAKRYLIERARKKQKRRKKPTASQLETLIVAMVNTEQFKYDFDSVRDLSIYQFNESVRQIIKKIDYDNRMIGVYSGSISAKDLTQDELNWIIHK